MRVLSDLHVHSRFAMACSSAITIEGIEEASQEKGVNLIGTGDFTHPTWFKEIKENLEPAEQGLFKVKNSKSGVRFIISGEVSTVYNANNKSRRIHNCILMPSFESVESLNGILSKYGDLKSDGRLQVSMSPAELVENVFECDSNAFVFPAHAWTPFFGVLGISTGYNSIREAYEDQEKRIFALEMGLSSDPPMNWRVSSLDKYALLANSDMHSLPRIGREMNMFEIDENNLSYNTVTKAIREKDKRVFKKTIKYFAEEGRYHFDGHRQCVVSVDPDKYKISNCPVCGKKLVVGVLHRVNDLADRKPGTVPSGAIPYQSLVPLVEVIAYVLRKAPTSVAVERTYRTMIDALGTEFDILANFDIEKISEKSIPEIAQAIQNVRKSKINIIPGYAGVYGKIDLLNRESKENISSDWKQKALGEFGRIS